MRLTRRSARPRRQPWRRQPGLAVAAGLLSLAAPGAGAQTSPALNALGTVGGLAIPSAHALGSGALALGWSNAREPQLPHQGRHANALLGLGLAPGLDLVARYADYAPHDERDFVLGDGRDLSVNLKFSAPVPLPGPLPLRVALGLQDPAGGKVHFRAAYAVASTGLGPWSASVGLGQGRGIVVPGARQALDGVFGGLGYALPLPAPAGSLHLAAEHDARQPVFGLRWVSAPLLAGSVPLRLNGALQRSLPAGPMPGATALNLGLTLDFGEQERRVRARTPVSAAAATVTAPPLAATVPPPAAAVTVTAPTPAAPAPAAAPPTPDRLGELQRQLIQLGLERVRVGRLRDGAWVVSYQNRRFGHHEIDALGVVAGLAARAAPPQVPALVVVAEKTAQPVLTLRTRPEAWRQFLDGGTAAAAREASTVTRGAALEEHAVEWLSTGPGSATALQLQLVPQLNLNVGTEYGSYEYSVALQVLASVPLWRGGQLVASTQQRVARSDQADPWGAFPELLQPEGLQALMLHQSLWLGQAAYVGGGVGRFEYGALGVEGEALIFVPGRDDVVRLRGRQLELLPEMPLGANVQNWLSYRWVATPSTWVEVGWQRHADLGSGPLATVSRWWGDFGVHLNYRRSGERQFAGLDLSFPITPRAAPAHRWVQVSGPSQWRRGLRTRITDSSNPKNFIEPRAAREYSPAWNLEAQVFNSGRLGPGYVLDNVARLREAFQRFAPLTGTEPPTTATSHGGSP